MTTKWYRRFLPALVLVLVWLVTAERVGAWENTAGENEWLHRLTLRHETPHTKWARPYALGQTRVLYFLESPFQGMGTHAREAVELMQRFDLTLDSVFYYRFFKPNWFGGVAGTRRIQRIMRDNSYDVYVFQDVSPELLPTWPETGSKALLRPAIEGGAGLVCIGTDDGGLLDGKEIMAALPDALADFPEAAAYRLGKGRIVELPARPNIPYKVGWQAEYEDWQQKLGRAVLWAAGRAPKMGLDLSVAKEMARANLPGEAVAVAWKDAAAGTSCQVTLRRDDGKSWALGEFPCQPAAGSAKVRLPKLRAGAYFVDAIASGEQGVATWASRRFSVAARASVKELALATEWAEIGGWLEGAVEVEGASPEDALRVRLKDRRGRILVRQDLGAATERRAFKFKVEPWMPMLLTVEAVVLDKDGEAANSYRFFNIVNRQRDKFNFVLWDFPVNDTLAPYAADSMAKMGVTAILSSKRASRTAAAYGIAWAPWTGGQIRSNRAEGWHDEKATNYFTMRMKESRGHGALVYSLGDEGAVEGAGVKEPAMNAYRQYLEGQYGNIAALNDSWGSAYAGFDEVALLDPKDHKEAAAREAGQYARWYDRQAFRSVNFVEFCVRHRDRLREFDEQAVLGFEGSGRFARRGDPYLICKTLKFWVPYAGSLDELVRSLTADNPEFLRGNWMGYHRTADGIANKYWRMVVSGSSSVWWWMWSAVGAWQGFVAPDLGAFEYVDEMLEDTRIVREGLGPMLRQSRQLHDGIAMLYSKPSTFAATVEHSPSYGDYEPNHRAWFMVIHDQPMQFRYVDSRMLTNGQFKASDFKVLILSDAVALGPKEAEAIREFARNGGTVIADLRPGVYSGHVKPEDKGALDELFGIAGPVRQAAEAQDVKIDGAVGETTLALEWPQLLIDPGVRLVGGKALGQAGEQPVCIVNEVGKGRAILLNLAMSSFPTRTSARHLRTWGTDAETPAEVAAFFKNLFATSGVAPAVELLRYKAKKNPYVGNIKMQRWRDGEIEILALHRETGARQQVGVKLPADKHVYDLRDQVYLGPVNWWMNQIIPSRARFFAILPQRSPAFKATMPAAAELGQVAVLKLSLPGAKGRHPVKLRAALPDGAPADFWQPQVLLDEAEQGIVLPLAVNDPAGEWTITITDLYTRDTEIRLKLRVQP